MMKYIENIEFKLTYFRLSLWCVNVRMAGSVLSHRLCLGRRSASAWLTRLATPCLSASSVTCARRQPAWAGPPPPPPSSSRSSWSSLSSSRLSPSMCTIRGNVESKCHYHKFFRTSELIYFSFLGPSLLLVSPTVSHSARELMWSLKAPRLSRAGRPHLLLTTETSLTRCMTCLGPRPPPTRQCWLLALCLTWRPPGLGRSSTGSWAQWPLTLARTPSVWWRRTTASARSYSVILRTVITLSIMPHTNPAIILSWQGLQGVPCVHSQDFTQKQIFL